MTRCGTARPLFARPNFSTAIPTSPGLPGRTARAEYEAVPGSQIVRLRTALCGPLGAMGDDLFRAGLVPAFAGAALVGVVLGAGWWAIIGFLLCYNGVRLWTGYWSLRTGMKSGMGVGSAINSSWLPRAIERVSRAAAFTVGAALPVVAAWYLKGFGWSVGLGAAAVAMAGVALTRWFGPTLTTVRFALAAMILLLALGWVKL